MKPKILVVDDEPVHLKMLDTVLSSEGYDIQEADDGETAIAAVEEQFYDLILMDIRMARVGGIEALKRIKELSPGIPVIIMTAYASVSTAVEALKSGAYDYLIKPLDIEELKILISNALHHQRLKEENLYLKERMKTRFDLSNIIGQSKSMRELFDILTLVAPTSTY
jgi:two-component system response regulator HydG